MADKQVLPRPTLLTESFLKRLVAEAIRKVQLRAELSDKDLADMISCAAETIGNARNAENKLQAHTLFNLLAVEPHALEGLLHHFGRRSVPIEAKCDTDALVPTAAAVHSIAMAMAPSSPSPGRLDDQELLDMEAELDSALEALSALKARCERIRMGAAA